MAQVHDSQQSFIHTEICHGASQTAQELKVYVVKSMLYSADIL